MPQSSALIQPLLAKSHAYLTRQTASWSRGLLRLALADPQVRALGWQVDAAALAGDAASVKQNCRMLWGVVLRYGKAAPMRRP